MRPPVAWQVVQRGFGERGHSFSLGLTVKHLLRQMLAEYLTLVDNYWKIHLHCNHRPSLVLGPPGEDQCRNHYHHLPQTKWDPQRLSIDVDRDFHQQFLFAYNLTNKINVVSFNFRKLKKIFSTYPLEVSSSESVDEHRVPTKYNTDVEAFPKLEFVDILHIKVPVD